MSNISRAVFITGVLLKAFPAFSICMPESYQVLCESKDNMLNMVVSDCNNMHSMGIDEGNYSSKSMSVELSPIFPSGGLLKKGLPNRPTMAKYYLLNLEAQGVLLILQPKGLTVVSDEEATFLTCQKNSLPYY